jgi:hypothetical protein
MPESKMPHILARRVFAAIGSRGDAAAQRAFAILIDSASRLPKGAKRPTDHLVHAAFRRQPGGARFFQNLGAALSGDDTFRAWTQAQLANVAPQSGDGDWATEIDFDKMAEAAAAKLAERGREAAPRGPEPADAAAKTDEKPPAENENGSVELELKDGTRIRVTPPATGPGTTTRQTGDDEDDPRDEPPPVIYGEESEENISLYAISVHTIECRETTDYTAVGVATLGVAGLIGLDDEVAWVGDGVAAFKGKINVPIKLASNGVHGDIAEGDVLSDFPNLIVPTEDQNTHLFTQEEGFLVNRFRFRGWERINQGGITGDFSPFNLDKFKRMQCTFTLLEDDQAVKDMVEELLMLLQELTDLASRAFDIATGSGTAIMRTIVRELSGSQAFRRINELLQRLITGQDKIGHATLRVTQRQIKTAFASGQVHQSSDGEAAFEYVADMPAQTYHIRGKGAHYLVKLRFERYLPND